MLFGQGKRREINAHGSMVDRLKGDYVDLPALGHLPNIARVAGKDHDSVRLRGLDRGAKVCVSHRDPGPSCDSGGGIGVMRIQRDISDREPVDERPRGSGPVPARLDPDRSGDRDADSQGPNRAFECELNFGEHAPVLVVHRVAEGLHSLVI
jgi:hypothetical protein